MCAAGCDPGHLRAGVRGTCLRPWAAAVMLARPGRSGLAAVGKLWGGKGASDYSCQQGPVTNLCVQQRLRARAALYAKWKSMQSACCRATTGAPTAAEAIPPHNQTCPPAVCPCPSSTPQPPGAARWPLAGSPHRMPCTGQSSPVAAVQRAELAVKCAGSYCPAPAPALLWPGTQGLATGRGSTSHWSGSTHHPKNWPVARPHPPPDTRVQGWKYPKPKPHPPPPCMTPASVTALLGHQAALVVRRPFFCLMEGTRLAPTCRSPRQRGRGMPLQHSRDACAT
jgi:hypothetical protein